MHFLLCIMLTKGKKKVKKITAELAKNGCDSVVSNVINSDAYKCS